MHFIKNRPIYLGAITTDLLEMEGILGGYAPEIIRNKPTKFFGWVFLHLAARQPGGKQLVGAAVLKSCVPNPDGGYIYSFEKGFYFSAKKLPQCNGLSHIWHPVNDAQRKAFNKATQLLRNHIEESLNPIIATSDNSIIISK